MSLNILEFVSICSKLAFQATKILRDIKQTGNLYQHNKGTTPVTLADLKVQCMIRSVLKKTWPDLQVVGQQTELCFETTHDHFNERLQEKFEKKFFEKKHLKNGLQKQLPIKDCCAWVDPLDATTSYTLGRLTEVTSLVGLSFKNKAKLGILGIPYRQSNSYKPHVMIGDSDHPVVYEIDQNFEIKNQITKRNVPQNYTIASIQNGSDELKLFVDSIGRGTVQTSGCGHKIVMMLEGKVDAMVFPGKQTSKWDTCASQALIRAVGGRMTDLYGNDIQYNPNQLTFKNSKGLICTLQHWQLQDIMKVTQKFRLD